MLKEIIEFISPDLIKKLKSFDFWHSMFIYLFGGFIVFNAIYWAIWLVGYLH